MWDGRTFKVVVGMVVLWLLVGLLVLAIIGCVREVREGDAEIRRLIAESDRIVNGERLENERLANHEREMTKRMKVWEKASKERIDSVRDVMKRAE